MPLKRDVEIHKKITLPMSNKHKLQFLWLFERHVLFWWGEKLEFCDLSTPFLPTGPDENLLWQHERSFRKVTVELGTLVSTRVFRSLSSR